jgi:hypothetical protein
MFQSLKDLLPEALRRGHMTRQVEAFQVVEAAASALASMLPSSRGADARPLSFKNGTLVVECRNAPAIGFVSQRKPELIASIEKLLPTAGVRDVRTRLVSEFHDTMRDKL